MAKIREYKETDQKELERLWLELQAYEKHIYEGRAEPTVELAEKLVSVLFKDIHEHRGVVYVAEKDGTLCGFVAGAQREEAIDISNHFFVQELVVSSNFRNSGIGTELMKRIEEYAKSIGETRIGLAVMTGNRTAYDFYKKLGFQDSSVELMKDI